MQRGFLAFAALMLLPASAVGQQPGPPPGPSLGPSYDFCVACTAPQAVYLCTVGPREPDPGARAWGAYCAERARVDAGHGQCSAQTLGQSCKATRAFVFRGPSATPRQAEALVSAEPARRAGAAEQIWQATVESVRVVGDGVEKGAVSVGRAVGESVEQSADVVGRGAGTVWDGLVDLGGNVARGAGCVVTLGLGC